MEYLTLNSGQKIPQLGFGTADIGSYTTTKSVIVAAFNLGFSRFDTASMYGNEKAIGDALESTVKERENIFIDTKLWDGGNFSYKNTKNEITRSKEKLKVDTLDIYLQHWPVQSQRLEAWRAMEESYETGEIKGIGVSNYTVHHLEELLAEKEIPPVINQVEFNPFLYQIDLLDYCKSNGIVLEAYSPFSKGRTLKNELLVSIADTHGKSTAQVILRWCIQLGISVIPKASSPEHMQQNFDIFDFSLSKSEMTDICGLDEGLRIEWDPTHVK